MYDTVLEMRNRRGGKDGTMYMEREAKAFESRVKYRKIFSAMRTTTFQTGDVILMPDGL